MAKIPRKKNKSQPDYNRDAWVTEGKYKNHVQLMQGIALLNDPTVTPRERCWLFCLGAFSVKTSPHPGNRALAIACGLSLHSRKGVYRVPRSTVNAVGNRVIRKRLAEVLERGDGQRATVFKINVEDPRFPPPRPRKQGCAVDSKQPEQPSKQGCAVDNDASEQPSTAGMDGANQPPNSTDVLPSISDVQNSVLPSISGDRKGADRTSLHGTRIQDNPDTSKDSVTNNTVSAKNADARFEPTAEEANAIPYLTARAQAYLHQNQPTGTARDMHPDLCTVLVQAALQRGSPCFVESPPGKIRRLQVCGYVTRTVLTEYVKEKKNNGNS
jgi:hypothetical protein